MSHEGARRGALGFHKIRIKEKPRAWWGFEVQ